MCTKKTQRCVLIDDLAMRSAIRTHLHQTHQFATVFFQAAAVFLENGQTCCTQCHKSVFVSVFFPVSSVFQGKRSLCSSKIQVCSCKMGRPPMVSVTKVCLSLCSFKFQVCFGGKMAGLQYEGFCHCVLPRCKCVLGKWADLL